MGQKDGEKWTAAVDSQPTLPKPYRLLGAALLATLLWPQPAVATAIIAAAGTASADQPAAVAGRATAAPAPRSNCPAAQAAVREFFIAADCSRCWGEAATEARPPTGWRFDWIVPVAADAAMAVAALPEAAERAERAPGAVGRPAPGTQSAHQRPALPARQAPRFSVVSGPAWQGYIGVELSLRQDGDRRWPAGSSAWIALVELVDAGSEGTSVARALVRTTAGPLPLPQADGRPLKHLRALRWPASALPERLQARAWIEGPDGALLAVAADRCP